MQVTDIKEDYFKNPMWTLYIIRLNDNSLYTGITKDLNRRMKQHSEGKGSKYVRTRLPLEVVHTEEYENRSKASKREAEVKKMSIVEKEKLVNGDFYY